MWDLVPRLIGYAVGLIIVSLIVVVIWYVSQ